MNVGQERFITSVQHHSQFQGMANYQLSHKCYGRFFVNPFYIFKDERIKNDHIKNSKPKTCMAM